MKTKVYFTLLYKFKVLQKSNSKRHALTYQTIFGQNQPVFEQNLDQNLAHFIMVNNILLKTNFKKNYLSNYKIKLISGLT